uniref:Reverse transcriptase domain-containing protein n=1 Tax=Lactuca sativa TaxID=4236 RepID=A0A9R1X318_LACSA|nr:hypothetical protein LSAT_V11C800406660 [Lactuca sativa]
MGGEKFTFMSRADAKLSKLDKFLVCPKFLSSFPLSVVTAFPRELSDHSPITLTSTESDFGPIPFKLFNSWLLMDGFDQIVKDTWDQFVGYGSPDAYLAAKLRYLKDSIKRWRRVASLTEKKVYNDTMSVVNNLVKIAETRPLSTAELDVWNTGIKKIEEWELGVQTSRAEPEPGSFRLASLIELSDISSSSSPSSSARAHLKLVLSRAFIDPIPSNSRVAWLWERLKTLDLKQKARVKWIINGDENSKFFHCYINNRNRRNLLHGLMINGRWSTDVNEIKAEVFRFYFNKFSENHVSRPKLINPQFKSISMMKAIRVESPISLDEVKAAIWDCGSEKAPGLDGFTFKFLKKYWDIIKGDVMNFVNHFERCGSFARGCNSSFIALAPKTKDPLSLNDFRPISLMGCLSKIISKILSNRLKTVIGKLIGVEQSAYVEGRCILDGPLIINEVCSWVKRARKKLLLFKVDFDKAFDSVNWQYLDSILEQMGFGNKWRMWIRGCLSSSRASVLINGSPTKEFPIFRGVRQGDPLSPYLFIIAMEGVPIPSNGPILSHLLYADDALFLGEWSRSNLKNLARILRCFHISSGLKVNYHKLKVFSIGVSASETVHWANLLGCATGALSFDYLGVPVGANMNIIKNWKPIIKNFHSKLSVWKSKSLSFGGRLTLLKSVLGNLPTYYLSLFKSPVGVLEELEKIRRSFLWGGCDGSKKIHWVSWEKVLVAKSNGGIGVGSIKALNIGLLVKWWWRLKNDSHSLWARVISGIHNLWNKPGAYLSNQSCVGVWNNICRIKHALLEYGLDVHDIFNVVLESGQQTLFW